MANTVIIHIGVPKTGSTAIQKFLFKKKEELKKLGLEYHETYALDDENPDYWAHHLLAHKWGGWMNKNSFPIQPDDAWKALREDVLNGDNRTILISSERFADFFSNANIDEVLKFIKVTLSPANIKIIGYVRNQIDLIESFYKQQVKVGIKVPPLKVYIERQLPGFLDFFEIFEKCSEYFGHDNIIVRSYENDLKKDGNIIYSFIKACGFKPHEDLFLNSDKKYNTSTSTLSTALLSHPDLKKINQRKQYQKAIRTLFDHEVTQSGLSPSLLTKEQRDYISQKYQSSNSNLLKNYSENNNDIRIDLDNIKETSFLKDEKFLISYDQIIDFLKVFNENLIDLSEDKTKKA